MKDIAKGRERERERERESEREVLSIPSVSEWGGYDS